MAHLEPTEQTGQRACAGRQGSLGLPAQQDLPELTEQEARAGRRERKAR
jgi:hypothetical protein